MAKARPAAATPEQQRQSAQRAAAARERIQQAQRRRRLTVVATVVGALVAVVAVLVVVRVVEGNSKRSGAKARVATASVTAAVGRIPASVFDSVGKGSATTPPSKIDGTTLAGPHGTPGILFVGAEYCPYCAAERWPITVALSRFGRFSGLGEVRSSPTDVYKNTATLTYHGSTYTSSYLGFTAKEIYTNQVADGSYTSLDTLTAAQSALFKKYTGGSFPFLYIDGRYGLNAAQYDPQVLQGLDQSQIAHDLSNPSSAVARAVIGAANELTAAICTVTGDKPANVCTASGTLAGASALKGGS